MKTKVFKCRALFARENNVPMYFEGTVLKQTSRAMYVYGKGTLEMHQHGICCVCGRELTHPVSVKLGIGPVCGEHYWNWDLVGGFTEENIERLKKELTTLMENMKVDQWFPKSVLTVEKESENNINIPNDHPMLTKKRNEEKQERIAQMVKYQNSGNYAIKVSFPYNQEDITKVKTLLGRKYSGQRYWTADLCIENVEKLEEWKFVLDGKLIQYLEKSKIKIEQLNPVDEIPGLKMNLFPYQQKGVAFIEAKNGRVLIGDEMGLGKTAQALAWLQLRNEKRPVVIVVPASLKLNWKREIEMWMDTEDEIQILSGSKPYSIIGDIVIINYDVLPYWVDELLKIKPQVLITDECHYFKNNSAKRTKAVKQLGKYIPHVLCLSGTPIVNRPQEIFNAVNIIDRTLFPNFWNFAHKYCAAKHNGFGWDFTGSSNTEELHDKLTQSIMIRRLKKDVLKELPDKVRSFTPIELGNENEYHRAERDFISWLKVNEGVEKAEKASNAQALAEIEGLKQLAVKGKLTQATEWIQNFLDVDGKLVVFATHKFVIDHLMNIFGDKAVKVDGSVSGGNRDKAVQRFQNDNSIRLFVGNIKAAGVGLTLTAASNVAFLELPWTPGDLTQAEDRCHRIGQKDTVNIHYLLAENTIEERIARLIDHKRKVLDSVLDGTITESDSLLSELMDELLNQ